MKFIAITVIGSIGFPCLADTVVPTRTIRAQEVIYAEDLRLHPAEIGGAFSAISDVAGKEARVALYPNRPVRPGDIGPPAIVERNQIVELIYDTRGLRIETAGRALDRAGIGDLIKVMNIVSRTTVIGKVDKDGSVSVSSAEFGQ
ncbi:flagellar basal body P-ring formation chaperone FlgA [Rhodalgimonas zhirmunskyi]|uniref:Flagella basal body P-ring formation protein FlgA n=1 Tax=Rhodalgimonas zhirmunskyi TaxID=2964767 RepID=A0AAJ1UDI4_9RHOB|nr:flagellar basal body P-ring formation chaperone FlgA [Rhodoalgimonas zhirmunskyi]MDQ2093987.1 flagellar basal body P-ring formation chaperone FlgA [Rhodoalgimonas zhirmunskyi]